MLGDPGALWFIWQEHDAAAIPNSVKAGNNFVIIYIDHDETLGAFDLDDVAAYAPGELPPVYLSPHKVEQQQQQGASGQVYDVPVRRGMRGRGREYIDLGDDSGGASDVEDEDYQPDIVDSDFDISGDDDDLLEDQLMADVKKKCRDVDIGLKEKGKQLVEDSLQAEHTCSRKWKVNAFTSTFLVDKYIESFRADDKMSLKNFSRTVQKEWNMTPSRAQLGRAKRAAMKKIHGDEVEQYNLLWDYAAELRRSNPGSSFFLNVDDCGRFSSCYFSFDANPKLKVGTRIGVEQPVQIETEDDLVITQDHNIFEPTTMPAASVIASLINESQIVPPQAPLLECEFIASQVDLSTQRPMPPSQSQVAEATRMAKQKALEDKKEAEQMKKLEQAEKRQQEATLKKQAQEVKRAAEAALKKQAQAEKRTHEAELKKIALAQKRAEADEARKIVAQEKRIVAEQKKAQAEEARQKALAQKRAQAEDAKRKAKSQHNKRAADTFITRPTKKVSMFDEFRDPPRSQAPSDD
ncbi:hypothetical protein ACQ4PT_065669 [Festuca glaucescens]